MMINDGWGKIEGLPVHRSGRQRLKKTDIETGPLSSSDIRSILYLEIEGSNLANSSSEGSGIFRQRV